MPQVTLTDLTAAAALADEPGFPPATTPKFGGVDPLGLRQINFDLMDQILPGLNNVARHIRPFVLVAWAWRRANQLAKAQGIERIGVDKLRDFVDRLEVIYAWSQFLRNPDADLPGRQVLNNLLQAQQWKFGGAAWQARRKTREYSTAFTAPINYGPGLKTMGWVEPHHEQARVLIPTANVQPALDAFESLISDRLDHPAFSMFGSVEVTTQEARGWSDAWALEGATEAEKQIASELLFGSHAPIPRRLGGQLMLTAVAHASTKDVNRVRGTMAGPPSNFVPPAALGKSYEAWRRMQIRQLFRLYLEATFYWILFQLEGGPKTSDVLVDNLMTQMACGTEPGTVQQWLDGRVLSGMGPTELIGRIQLALDDPGCAQFGPAIADALSFCLREAPSQGQDFERMDRLPLFRARHEAQGWAPKPVRAFLRHVIESWVLAQHVYWSVGRGLADARARGKTLLRLKVILDEGGWALTPGIVRGSPPVPTADRLQTALSLAEECGLAARLSPAH